jgi:hypothetical protein
VLFDRDTTTALALKAPLTLTFSFAHEVELRAVKSFGGRSVAVRSGAAADAPDRWRSMVVPQAPRRSEWTVTLVPTAADASIAELELWGAGLGSAPRDAALLGRGAMVAGLPYDNAFAQKRLQEAQALLRDLQRRSDRDYYAFATAVRSRSDDLATKAFGGDLPLLSRAELEGRLGPEVAEAAFALRGTDTLGSRVIETPSGFHLLKLRARVEASSADLAILRERVRTRLAAERRAQAESDLYAGLERRAELHFDDAAIAAVQPAGAGERTARR